MSGANPAIRFDPMSPSNSVRADNRFIQAGLTQPTTAAKAKREAQTVAQEWQKGIRELGQEIARVRQARGLSLYQLHSQTLVPLYHLKALETGQIDKLPEPIYVRGFIRRIGDAIEMDGDRIAAYLPPSQPRQSSVSSQQHVLPWSKLLLEGVHFYLAYAVIIAIATATLLWLSSPTTSKLNSTPLTDNSVELQN